MFNNKNKFFSYFNVIIGFIIFITFEIIIFAEILKYRKLQNDSLLILLAVAAITVSRYLFITKKVEVKNLLYSILIFFSFFIVLTVISFPFKNRYAKTGISLYFIILPLVYFVIGFLAGMKFYNKQKSGLILSWIFSILNLVLVLLFLTLTITYILENKRLPFSLTNKIYFILILSLSPFMLLYFAYQLIFLFKSQKTSF